MNLQVQPLAGLAEIADVPATMRTPHRSISQHTTCHFQQSRVQIPVCPTWAPTAECSAGECALRHVNASSRVTHLRPRSPCVAHAARAQQCAMAAAGSNSCE
jgi:hypothetical protein